MYVYLCNFTNSDSLIIEVRQLPYCGGNTDTTAALRLTLNDVFTVAHCDRPDVPNLVILITDGNPTREVDELPDVVQRVKDAGIRIIGVGVTSAVSSVLLRLPYNETTKLTGVAAAPSKLSRFLDIDMFQTVHVTLPFICIN